VCSSDIVLTALRLQLGRVSSPPGSPQVDWPGGEGWPSADRLLRVRSCPSIPNPSGGALGMGGAPLSIPTPLRKEGARVLTTPSSSCSRPGGGSLLGPRARRGTRLANKDLGEVTLPRPPAPACVAHNPSSTQVEARLRVLRTLRRGVRTPPEACQSQLLRERRLLGCGWGLRHSACPVEAPSRSQPLGVRGSELLP
jgi:hypothetical protein